MAIALTLLVLPLMESVSEATRTHLRVPTAVWLDENQGAITGFLMSFVLVAAYWTMHHGAMRDVRRFTGTMLAANFLWILAIVLMPVTTGITIAFRDDPVQAAVYLGNFVLIAVALGWIQIETLRRPDIQAPSPGQWTRLGATVATLLALLVCFVLVVWTPLGWAGMFGMLLIGVLARPIGKLLRNRFAH